jgi:Tfp pilus assembly protein PilF
MPAHFRCLSVALCASTLLLSPLGRAQQPATTNVPSSTPTAPAKPATSALTSTEDQAKKLIVDAIQKMNANDPDIDGALNDLSQALKLNPNSTGAYVLRASLYCQKKQWIQAENDFNAAARLAPTNVVVKFNLSEIKFMQKEYDVARPGFVALEKDPDMGDFASYKVFLCDLFGGHEDAAKKELDAFNDAGGNPSYYFSNAAWSLVHKNLEDARGWLVSASNIYPPRKNNLYAQSLRDMGYLPIPGPNDKITPPDAGAPSHP